MAHIDLWLYDTTQDKPDPVRTHIILGRLLHNYLGKPAEITVTAQGKPITTDIYFNISKTKRYVLYGFSQDVNIGVDVEAVRPHKADVHSILHRKEVATWQTVPDKHRMFFRIWTRKEAVLKAMGVGLTRDPTTLYVGVDTIQNPIENRWIVCDVPTPVGWAAALAYESLVPVEIHHYTVNPKQLLERHS